MLYPDHDEVYIMNIFLAVYHVMPRPHYIFYIAHGPLGNS